jgi:hypothetical protein
MNKEHKQAPKAAKVHSKPDARPAPPAIEQPSRAIERAEGEGMIPHAGSAPKGTVRKGDAERLSAEAAKALDGAEGAALRKAEQAANHGHAR